MKSAPEAQLIKDIQSTAQALRALRRERAETRAMGAKAAARRDELLRGEQSLANAPALRAELDEQEVTADQAVRREAFLNEKEQAITNTLMAFFAPASRIFQDKGNAIRTAGREELEHKIIVELILPEHEAIARTMIGQLFQLSRAERAARVMESIPHSAGARGRDPLDSAEKFIELLTKHAAETAQ